MQKTLTFFLISLALHAAFFFSFEITDLRKKHFHAVKLRILKSKEETAFFNFPKELYFLNEPSLEGISLFGPSQIISNSNESNDLSPSFFRSLEFRISGSLAKLTLAAKPDTVYIQASSETCLDAIFLHLNVETLGESGKIIFYEVLNSSSLIPSKELNELMKAFRFYPDPNELLVQGTVELKLLREKPWSN